MEVEQNQNHKKGYNINQKVDYNIIASNFVNFYYHNLDTNLSNLIDVNGKFIYKGNSEYCIQGQIIKNQEQIYARLLELNKRGCAHNVHSIDVVTSGSRRLNILVTGQIKLDDFLYSFTEYFHLASGKKENEWWIQSDILRTL